MNAPVGAMRSCGPHRRFESRSMGMAGTARRRRPTAKAKGPLTNGNRSFGDDDTPPPKPKQTVSVKTVSAVGVTGVLESEEDIDRYLAALRDVLIQTLKAGKRISL